MTSILPFVSTGCGGLSSLNCGRGWARATGASAKGASASTAARRRRAWFMSVRPLACGIADLDQARVDSVLRESLAHAVDLVHLAVRSQAHPVPGAFVGQARRLHARLEAEDGELRLLVVRVGRVLERARLEEVNVPDRFLLTARGAAKLLLQLALRDRLLLPRQDLVEVEFRLLGCLWGLGAALRGAGDRRRLRRSVLLGGLWLRGGERDRRLVDVERDRERDAQAEQQADEHPEQKPAAGVAARRGGHSGGSRHHIFSGAPTPRSARPFASVWRTAAHSARRAARSPSPPPTIPSAFYYLF